MFIDLIALIPGPVLGAIVTGSIALIIWWLNRNRPSHIKILDLEFTSLLRVAETFKPRIVATLDGITVERLSQLVVAITNICPQTVSDVTLKFSFPSGTKVLECHLAGVESYRLVVDSQNLDITIPYLNSYKHHKDILTATILCDGDASTFIVIGRGNGWSARRVTFAKMAMWRLFVSVLVFSSMVIIAYLFNRYARGIIGVVGEDFSWQLFILQTPAFMILVVTQFFLLRWQRRVVDILKIKK